MTEQDLFRTLIRSMPIGVLVQGPNAEILLDNLAAQELLGLSEDQLLGRTSFDPDWNVVHEDGSPYPAPTHPVPRAIATRQPVRDAVMGVFRPRTRDRVWLLVNAEPLLAEDGSVEKVICTFSDLSERMRSEQALRENEERYRQLVENATDLIYRTDAKGRFSYANPVTLRVLSCTREDLLGLRYTDLVRPDFREQARHFYRQQQEAGVPSTYWEVPVVTRDGRELWIGQQVERVVEIGGGVSYQAVARDITERKRMESELRESEERFRQLAQGVDTVLFIRQTDPLRTLYVSPAWERISGRPASQLIGHGLEAVLEPVHPDDRAAVAALLADPSRPYQAEHRILRPDGRVRWLRTRGFPVRDEAGALRRVVGLADDVTDRRLVDAMRDDLVQTLVHDLRSPLAAVSGALGLLSQRAAGDASAEDVVATARLGVARLLKLIDSILDVNRLEQGAMPVVPRPLEVGPLLQDLLRATEPQAREKGVRLELRLGALPRAFADPELLARVLENLVGNALKFTPSGGAVWIAAQADDDAVRLSVGDTGTGIPEEVRDRLFGKFVTGQHPARGSGLGLAFCRLAIQAQGGRIWAESPAGGGTLLRLTLPRATE